MLLRFSMSMDLADVLDWDFVAAYFVGSLAVYALATLVAIARRVGVAEAAIEAQCAIIGNVGFLGIPMLALLLGDAAIGPIMMVLAVDLVFFGSLVVILITGSRDGRLRLGTLKTVFVGVVKNPMVMSIIAGLAMSQGQVRLPVPAMDFLTLLGAAATPGALFAIGGSLAGKTAERLSVASYDDCGGSTARGGQRLYHRAALCGGPGAGVDCDPCEHGDQRGDHSVCDRMGDKPLALR